MQIHVDLPLHKHGDTQIFIQNSGDLLTHPSIQHNATLPSICNPQHNRFEAVGVAMAMPLFDFRTKLLNPRISIARLASSPPGHNSGWSLSVAAPQASTPAPNRRCLELQNQLVALVASGPRPGPLARALALSLEAFGPSRMSGMSLALSSLGLMAALLCGPVRVHVRRARGGRESCVAKQSNLQSAWPLTLLHPRLINEAHYRSLNTLMSLAAGGSAPGPPRMLS